MTDDRGVVVHLVENDADHQRAVLRNVVNLHAALDDGRRIELVAHGPGLALLTGETGLAEQLRELLEGGVSARACENTMRSRTRSRTLLAASSPWTAVWRTWPAANPPGVGLPASLTPVHELLPRRQEYP